MLTNQTPASPRRPTYSAARHPHYFGHYLNQARHNAYMVMADLEREYDIVRPDHDPLQEENLVASPLLRLLDDHARPDESARLLRDLARQFPFLQCLETDQHGNPQGIEPKAAKKALMGAFVTLNQLRNRYSHFGYPEMGLWQFPLLRVYRKAVARLRPRYERYAEEHIRHLLHDTGNPAHLPNDPTQEAYNEKALVFFTCLFLERAEASRFIRRLYGFHDTTTPPHRATLDCYREFCCQLPQPKLESSDILLDMFNELARCPEALYPALSPADRERFHRTPDLGDYEQPEDVPPSVLKRHSDRFPWFALRYFDDRRVFPTLRFHIHLGQFATGRYDKTMNAERRERVLLRPLRVFARWPQVDTTDLRRRLDTLKDERAKSKLLHDALPESWRVRERGIWKLRPEMEQFATRYRFDQNCIGIRFVPEAEQQGFPELPTERGAKGRFSFQPADTPHAIISTYELAALFLHQRLHGPAQTEAFIQDYIRRFRALCTDLKAGKIPAAEAPPFLQKTPKKEARDRATAERRAENAALREARSADMDALLKQKYDIPLRYLPDAFREYLLSYRPDRYQFAALEKLKAKRKDTRYLLKDIGYIEGFRKQLELPPNPDIHRAPKSGDIGSWLAEDIVFFKPLDHNGGGKPNDAQYVILQEMLSLFGGYRKQLASYFRELGLTGKEAEAPHPFLHKIKLDDCKGILTFYDRYLWARLDYVQTAIDELDPYFGKRPPDVRTKQGLDEEQIRRRYGHILPIDEKTALEKDYSEVPVFLPRGLFNTANEAALRQAGKLLPQDKTVNMVLGLDRYSNGAAQPMYEWPRYVLPPGKSGERGELVEHKKYIAWLQAEGKRLKNARPPRPGEPNPKAALAKEANRLYEREQVIRYTQALDRVLWFMALDRAADRSEELNLDFTGLTLRDIETVLTSDINLSPRIGHVTLNDRLTIRRYGEMRRILKDRRLDNLLAHFPEPCQVKHEDIKAAFEEHERRRVPFFERVYKFEQAVFEKFAAKSTYFSVSTEALAEEGSSKRYFSHWDYLNTAFENLPDGAAFIIEKDKLGNLRNKLIHNEIPLPELLPTPADTSSCVGIVDSIFDQAEGYYDRLLELLGLPKIELVTFIYDDTHA